MLRLPFPISLVNFFACFRCPSCGSICCDIPLCGRCGWSE